MAFSSIPQQGYYTTCLKETSVTPYRHQFCGEHEIPGATCPNCNRALLRMLWLDTTDPRLGLQSSPFAMLPLMLCWGCAIGEVGRLHYRVEDDGGVAILEYAKGKGANAYPYAPYPTFFPDCPISLDQVPEAIAAALAWSESKNRNDAEADKHIDALNDIFAAGERHQVGGIPFLAEVVGAKPCVVCGKTAPGIAVVADDTSGERGFTDDNDQAIFRYCRECRVVGATTDRSEAPGAGAAQPSSQCGRADEAPDAAEAKPHPTPSSATTSAGESSRDFACLPRQGYYIKYLEDPSAPPFRHYFCGQHDIPSATCPNCDKPLLGKLWLDTTDPRLELQSSPFEMLPLFFCWGCAIGEVDRFSYLVESHGGISILDSPKGGGADTYPYEPYPAFFPGCSVSLEPVPAMIAAAIEWEQSSDTSKDAEETYDPILDALYSEQQEHQIGGLPYLGQFPRKRTCPVCKRSIPLLAAVADCAFGKQRFVDADVQTLYSYCGLCHVVETSCVAS